MYHGGKSSKNVVTNDVFWWHLVCSIWYNVQYLKYGTSNSK